MNYVIYGKKSFGCSRISCKQGIALDQHLIIIVFGALRRHSIDNVIIQFKSACYSVCMVSPNN